MQGFGNVGSRRRQELHQRGVKIIAVGDRYGAIRNDRGIDIGALNKHMYGWPGRLGAATRRFPRRRDDRPEELLTLPCTVAGAGRPGAGDHEPTTPRKLRCRVLAEGANGPTTPDADAILAATTSSSFPTCSATPAA